jgi:hypothetical protein
VCDLFLLNLAVLVVSGLSEVLGALRQILLSYLVHMHSRLRYLRQGQVHVGPITWEVLPQIQRHHRQARIGKFHGHSALFVHDIENVRATRDHHRAC